MKLELEMGWDIVSTPFIDPIKACPPNKIDACPARHSLPVVVGVAVGQVELPTPPFPSAIEASPDVERSNG